MSETSSSRSPATRVRSVLDVGDPLEVDACSTAGPCPRPRSPGQEELGQVGAVLAGDPGDQRSLGHRRRSPCVGRRRPGRADPCPGGATVGAPLASTAPRRGGPPVTGAGRRYDRRRGRRCRRGPRRYSAAVTTAAIVSFRLGGHRRRLGRVGQMAWALGRLGFDGARRWPAGPGRPPAARAWPSAADRPPTPAEVARALDRAPTWWWSRTCARSPSTRPAAAVVAAVLPGPARPCSTTTTWPWQRPHLAHHPAPARRPGLAPRHHQRAEPARAGRPGHRRGRPCTTPSTPRPGGRGPPGHPTGARRPGRRAAGPPADPGPAPQERGRAAWPWPRRLGATYWLLGPAEDGYDARARRACAGGPVPGAPRSGARR